MKMKKFFLVVIITALIAACSSSDEGGTTERNDTFDRSALLTNVADNIIIPAFEDLQSNLSALGVARGNFINNMTQSNLDALSDAWLEAYKTWQYVEMFNIGKAEENGGLKGFVSFFNIYPVTIEDIQTGAANGNYDLNSANYHDAQGFPALDFLIHGVADSDATALDKFTTNPNKEGYVDYITNVVAQMNALNNSFINDWKNVYRDSFVSSTGNTITSALNKTVNDFVYYYEKGLRANKVGTPAGNFSNSPLPSTVEALYKRDVSKELALEALDAVQDFFNGKSYSGSATGESFRTYLNALDRGDLVTLINSRFDDARQKIQALDDSFYDQINSDNTKMTQAYDALQMAVVSLKVDMVQAFGVVIDFQDADGD